MLALDKCTVTPYDVIVLDRDLPVVHGDTVCRELAEQGQVRILMLTASGAVEDRVEGLTLSADDFGQGVGRTCPSVHQRGADHRRDTASQVG